MERLGKREYKYDVIRIILTALVVIGHANYYNAGNAYGGIYILDSMTQAGIADTTVHGIAEQIKLYIYTFHMPAFFALSGALFCMQLKSGRIQSFKELLKNKASRLLVPFAVVYLFWNTPIKILSGYYTGSENIIKDIAMQMLIPTNMYLWYLEALFLDFILGYLISRIFPKMWQVNTAAICIYLVVMFAGRVTTAHMLFGNPLRYLLWFILGMNIERITNTLKSWVAPLFNHVGGILLLALCWTAGYYALDYLPHLIWLAKDLYLGFLGILTVWIVCGLIADCLSESGRNKILKVSGYTFGVYLYAEPLNFLIVAFFAKYVGLGFFGLEWGALAIWFLRVIGTPLIAVFVVKLLKKTKLKLTLY